MVGKQTNLPRVIARLILCLVTPPLSLWDIRMCRCKRLGMCIANRSPCTGNTI